MCIKVPFRSLELGLVGDRYSYKHSAPTELTAFGCDPAAPCLRGELLPAIKLTTETRRTRIPEKLFKLDHY